MTITCATETYAQVIDEIKPLFNAHWCELALNQDAIELDPDYEYYELMDRADRMLVVTARDNDGPIVGYAVYFIDRHKHYRQHKWAVADIIWLHPDHRRGRVGDGLLAFVEQALKVRGVSVMHTTSKTAHPALARLLDHRGHEMIEVGHSLRLI